MGKSHFSKKALEHNSSKEDGCEASGHKGCFSHAEINEGVYVENLQKTKQFVYKLQKSIYRLKQAARCGNKGFE